MRAVNLLPKGLEPAKKGPSTAVVAAGATAVLAAALLAIGWVSASSHVSDEQSALAAARAELAAVPAPPAPPASSSTIPQERAARVAALSSALATRVAWDRILREVSLVLPDDVWLTQLDGQVAATDAIAEPGKGLHLIGYTYSQASVARLLARLQVIPDLGTVTLNSSTAATLGKRAVVQFDVGADLKATTPAAPAPPATTTEGTA
jgi:Tfp pilus assembly protein PilN